MIKRLQYLIVLYVVPLAFSISFMFSDITREGEAIGLLEKGLMGFVVGSALEGLLMLALVTYKVLTCPEKELK